MCEDFPTPGWGPEGTERTPPNVTLSEIRVENEPSMTRGSRAQQDKGQGPPTPTPLNEEAPSLPVPFPVSFSLTSTPRAPSDGPEPYCVPHLQERIRGRALMAGG